jgi:hypothetical protein
VENASSAWRGGQGKLKTKKFEESEKTILYDKKYSKCKKKI